MVEFSIEKADDDKSWDIAYDFNKIAKLLVNENDLNQVNNLKVKTLKEFNVLKESVFGKISESESIIVAQAKAILNLIEESGLEPNDFSRESLPKHFNKLANRNMDVNFDLKWQEDIETKTLYPSRVTDDIAEIIETIQPEIAKAFNTTKEEVFNLKFYKAIYKTITPLSVLNAIRAELDTIKEEDNTLLISEFNSIISNEIKNQPTPYIYERLGEKYKHYFIDEFQDTSHLQWLNLQPLVSNALEQEQNGESGSLLLVGDAKQAIYRWRGGYAEQFISLFNATTHPFVVKQNVVQLETNYRSAKAIVDFNNKFFRYLSQNFFSDEGYSQLYESASQAVTSTYDGYVNLDFIEFTREDDKYEMYSEKVYDHVCECLELGYRKKDITILVRRKAEGLAIAQYLSERDIPILSSETLLLQNSEKIKVLNDILTYIIEPQDKQAKVKVLHFLAKKFGIASPHEFLKQHINLNQNELFSALEIYGLTLEKNTLQQLSLYDLVESLIRIFLDVSTTDGYLQTYLDEVFRFSEKSGGDIKGFLEYFELKKSNLAVTASEELDAVKIMTIHKSKGLEFPVVIFPFADLDIYNEIDARVWYSIDEKEYEGFSNILLNYTKDIQHFGPIGNIIYNRHRAELELDNINLLYVTLTRAVEQLYVISKADVNSKGEPKLTTYSGNLIAYLQNENLWETNKQEYSFGYRTNISSSKDQYFKNIVQSKFISNSISAHNINIVTKSGLLWDTIQQEAIERGNLIHDIMSHVKTLKDIDFVLNRYLETGRINHQQLKQLKELIYKICLHDKLSEYYKEGLQVYNEREILTKEGVYIRPDRLVFLSKTEVVLIDYKSGDFNPKHQYQLINYAEAIEQMGISVAIKILVYVNDEVTIKEF